jgi:hypothetical protein
VGAKFSLFNGIVLFSRRDDVGGTSRALFSDDSSRSVAKHFFIFLIEVILYRLCAVIM